MTGARLLLGAAANASWRSELQMSDGPQPTTSSVLESRTRASSPPGWTSAPWPGFPAEQRHGLSKMHPGGSFPIAVQCSDPAHLKLPGSAH